MRKRSTALILVLLLAAPVSAQPLPLGRVTPVTFVASREVLPSESTAHVESVTAGAQHPAENTAPLLSVRGLSLSTDNAVQAAPPPTMADVMAALAALQLQVQAIQAAQNAPSWISDLLHATWFQMLATAGATYATCVVSKKC